MPQRDLRSDISSMETHSACTFSLARRFSSDMSHSICLDAPKSHSSSLLLSLKHLWYTRGKPFFYLISNLRQQFAYRHKQYFQKLKHLHIQYMNINKFDADVASELITLFLVHSGKSVHRIHMFGTAFCR